MEKTLSYIILCAVLLLQSCGDNKKDSEKNKVQNSVKFALTDQPQSLDPIRITDINSFHVASQIFEPLLRFSEKTLKIEPCIAKSWSISDNKLVYSFSLKKGILFQDNTCFEKGIGREITSKDILYTFKRIYSEPSSYGFILFKGLIKGSENYNGGEIEGIKAIDSYTIEFTLAKPNSNFLNNLASINSSIVAKEAIEKNEIVGSGPFLYQKEINSINRITLPKNLNYHILDKNGDHLPYLDSVSFHFVKSPQEQLKMFLNDELDLITNVPPTTLKELVEFQISDFQNKRKKYVLGRSSEIITSYLTLNTAIAPFNNLKVRQAIAMSINKSKIVEEILKGNAFSAGNNGIVSSAIKNYDYSSVIGLEYDLKKAKKLLAEAGFPEGKGFPSIKLASLRRNISTRVILEIQKQLLTNLNINVEISSISYKEMMEMNNKSELNMSLKGWLGDFPDPTSFLSLFYGADVPSSPYEMSYPNESRFKNKQFDKLYEKAIVTSNEAKRYEICLQADQIIATEVPGIPLWHHENYNLIKSNIRGYQSNSMNIKNLIYVQIKKETTKNN
jgi:ABC-type transport system substrate-binding protein